MLTYFEVVTLCALVGGAMSLSQADREAVCENRGFQRSECQAISCCEWDDGTCWAGSGGCDGSAAALDSDSDAGSPISTDPLNPCLDEYAARLGISAVPSTASAAYKALYCKYTHITAPNGKPIEIFGQQQLSSLQLYRARNILEHYLRSAAGTTYGYDKGEVANSMANNGAKLDMPNGAHEQPGAGRSLEGQELFWAEMPVEGSAWYMTNDYDHRDAGFEEILHLVHDAGIGIDIEGYPDGALPQYQQEIRNATTNAQPTWLSPAGSGLWGECCRVWIEELQDEGSLTQEYLASVIDAYYGLWGPHPDEGGMWGIYAAKTRSEIFERDIMGWNVVNQFFSPYLTWMVMLDPELEGSFTMTFRESSPYTWKSQYITHATLLGGRSSNLQGNARDNRLGPNAGENTLDGMAGHDTVVFQGNCSEYTFSFDEIEGDVITIEDSVALREGITHIENIEELSFADGVYGINMSDCATITHPPSTLSSPIPPSTFQPTSSWPITSTSDYPPEPPPPTACENNFGIGCSSSAPQYRVVVCIIIGISTFAQLTLRL
ncbi:hypothetical protein CYMTET_17856 [Cymbomonas tetramitiformis]|uniref:Uncharacterized protein n=1 Tax=Cymbomonas tetramitiformis TaxID=36881 RepID=A0AAE0L6Q7_9CHLO|nr:hypothetical protein CYMTET_17856 [Cymbomonas tetramitiformis]